MPSILDSRDEIKKLDVSNLLGSVEALPDQIIDALEQTKDLVVPDSYRTAKNVVVAGMGGSILGSIIIKGLFSRELQVPFENVQGYNLPDYVNQDTLVLLSSYSGTTEETLSCAQDALKRGAKIMAITSGNDLAALAVKHNWPCYLINPKFNPSGQPRLSLGYAITGQLNLFAKAGIIADQTDSLIKVVAGLKAMLLLLSPEAIDNNTAKLLAYAAFEKHVIISGAEHLAGAAHVFNNQVNENAKALTSEWHLPEFNHHYSEALQFPKANLETTIFFFFNSNLYSPRMIKCFPLTSQLVSSKGYETQLIQATAPTKLEQVFEIILLGGFVASYLAFLYKIPDPGPVPNVEWFKAELNK